MMEICSQKKYLLLYINSALNKHDSLQIISTHCVLNFDNILGYGAAPTGYGEEDSFPDLTPFLTLSLVILGLSLLFPAIVTITDVNSDTDNTDGMVAMDGGKRKRRYADEGNKKSVINCLSGAICVQFA